MLIAREQAQVDYRSNLRKLVDGVFRSDPYFSVVNGDTGSPPSFSQTSVAGVVTSPNV